MIYIYDIILNFQKNYYQFFEWMPEDKIINIPKVSLYRVSDKDIMILKENNIKVSEEFINRIKEDNKRHKKIICIVSNGKIALALLFNNKGNLLKRSSLIFEEEEEATSLVHNLKEISISYEKNINHKYKNILRIEKEKKDTIISYLKNTNDILTLKYLYYEYYEKESNNPSLLKESLLKELSKEWTNKQKKLYNIINLLLKTN